MRLSHRRLVGLAIGGLALVTIGCGGSSPAAERLPEFTPTGSLGLARADFTATRLADGRVLLVGGTGDGSVGTTAEVYDPATRACTATGEMSSFRAYHVAALLPNGRVLVAGGANAPAAAEEYDPASRTFAVSGETGIGHLNATATGLTDGTVLVAAGYAGPATTTAVERYNPASNPSPPQATSSTPGPATRRPCSQAGRCSWRAGANGFTTLATAELFDSGGAVLGRDRVHAAGPGGPHGDAAAEREGARGRRRLLPGQRRRPRRGGALRPGDGVLRRHRQPA